MPPGDVTGAAQVAPMIPDQRRESILRQLRQHGVLSVHQLMEMFGCSHMTVRRDISVLEREGHAYSVPGGVRIASQLSAEPSHQLKSMVEPAEKQGIARCAAEMLQTGMTVYLDAGTTTLSIVPHLAKLENMTVITNDFPIVEALVESPHVKVIHVGGVLDHSNRSSVGPLAAATLLHLYSDIAFISSSSWDLQRGLTTPAALKVEVKRAAMHSASRTALVTTSSKYGTFGTYKISPLEDFDLVITDSALPDAVAARLRDANVGLVLADPVENLG
ncbi:cytochrome C [Robbsia andropogonis]|uniref:Cytochrome C n=2 Tax=Robbsia andropogonis TaxID=28092 RepID=A0A0F5JXI0_9BURK|nr:DeoR/GlpR family DNA-binding transcription regulator [Robbsia andropogonis]KKB61997.1 cytochrome C [Robbsia andropogonis]MCP1120839.1 DeoR/GlpR family DNA-binding transcription regulator [Robbsia andropogonis]MCP1130632.1 DeoR/GlpR family DNA-binding transcription regulator [Robbsia andropogonis]